MNPFYVERVTSVKGEAIFMKQYQSGYFPPYCNISILV